MAVANEVLELLDAGHLANRHLGDISGGERQRVVLARALAQEPEVLLLDEPTTALDIGHQVAALEMIGAIRKERPLTIVAAMHDLSLAGQFTDRLVMLAAGRIVASGPRRRSYPAPSSKSTTTPTWRSSSVRRRHRRRPNTAQLTTRTASLVLVAPRAAMRRGVEAVAKPAIVAVDDDPQVAAAVARDLRKRYAEDYRIVAADSGAEALDAVQQLKDRGDAVALLLADQRMPEMEGTEFLTKAREIVPRAKRLLLTAYADTEAAISAINEVGLDYYLMKPWDPPDEKLYPVLDEMLDDWNANSPHRLTASACSAASGRRPLTR